MYKSINTSDERLEKLISFVEDTGDSMKIVCLDVRENVEGALLGSHPIPENCPSRPSLAEFGMRRLKKYVNEIMVLTNDLEKYIFENYSDKR